MTEPTQVEPFSHQSAVDVLVRVAKSWLVSGCTDDAISLDDVRRAIVKANTAGDPGALALVLHDYLAPRVLAWWQLRRPRLAELSNLRFTIAADVNAESLEQLDATIERCQMCGLLEDGGVSLLASNWLRAHVAQQVGIRAKKK